MSARSFAIGGASPVEMAAAVLRRLTGRARSRPTPLVAALLAEKMAFFHCAVISVFLSASVLGGSVFFEQANDRVLPHKNVITLAILFAVLSGLLIVAGYLHVQRDHILARVSSRLDRVLRPALFDACLQARFDGRIENARTALDDFDKLRAALAGRVAGAVYDFLQVPIYLVFCFGIHVYLGSFVLGALCVIAVLATIVAWKRTRYENELAEISKAKTDTLLSTFINIETVQALGMRQVFRERWINGHRRALQMSADAEDRLFWLDTLLKVLVTGLTGFTVAVGGYYGIQGQISPGNLVGVMLISGKLVKPVLTITTEWGSIVKAKHAFDRLQVLFLSLEQGRRESYEALPAPR
ncbi:ABC transporter transmembrane domain-containing protein, partial [Methylobacterium jeotgali]